MRDEKIGEGEENIHSLRTRGLVTSLPGEEGMMRCS